MRPTQRDRAPDPNKWYFDAETGNLVKLMLIQDDKFWWVNPEGDLQYYSDQFAWYIWGRFS